MDRVEFIVHQLRLRIPAIAVFVGLLCAGDARAATTNAVGDSIVVVVSSASSLIEISKLHLADIYLGRTSRFESGVQAVPLNQRAGTEARSQFSVVYLGRTEAQMKAHWSKIIFTGRGRPPAEESDAEAIKRRLTENPRAIAYIDSSQVDWRVRVVRVR